MSELSGFPGRLGLQQRVLPDYRAAFFDRLARACRGGLSVFAGLPDPDEGVRPAKRLEVAQLQIARNVRVGGGPARFWLQPGIEDWLQAWDPAALILEANPRYLSNRAALRWMHARSRVVLGWGLGAPTLARPWDAVRRRYLRRFDALIAYSSQGAQQYLRAGLPAGRVFVAPNAASAAPPPLPNRPAHSAGPVRILFVGRLQARKRVDLLLQACAALPARPELLIVGEGPERAGLERLGQRIYPQARFLGERRGPELEQLFRQADLFVLPGTGGLAVQQAMAHGLPVVVAEADGTQRELVRPENGWLIAPGDLQGLTEALQQALADPLRLRRMGQASHRITVQEVNIEVMTQAFLQALQAVAGGGLK
jgi:glycosyltransferase involved in cell wall biosynthesis